MREALEQMQADMRERWADPFYLLWYGTKQGTVLPDDVLLNLRNHDINAVREDLEEFIK